MHETVHDNLPSRASNRVASMRNYTLGVDQGGLANSSLQIGCNECKRALDGVCSLGSIATRRQILEAGSVLLFDFVRVANRPPKMS